MESKMNVRTISAPMGEGKSEIMRDARGRILTVEERKFVETHRLVQEAAAVARQIINNGEER